MVFPHLEFNDFNRVIVKNNLEYLRKTNITLK